MTTTHPQDRWFLDVRGEVRPASTNEIIDGLIKGDIKVIHRVSHDRVTWNAICNEPYFEQFINFTIGQLNTEANQSGTSPGLEVENAQSGFHDLKKLKSGISSQLQHASTLQDINHKLHVLRELASEIHSKRKHVVDMAELEDKDDEMHVDDRNVYINAPQTGLYHRIWNPIVRKRIFVTLIFAVIGWVGYNKYLDLQVQKKILIEAESLQAGLQAQNLGRYDQAVQHFTGVTEINSLDATTLIAMSDAYAGAKQNHTSIDLLKRALHVAESKNQSAIINDKLARQYMQSNDLQNAKTYYLEALKQEQIYSSMVNLGLLYNTWQDFKSAEPLFLQALTLSGHDKIPPLFGLFEVSIILDKQDNATLRVDRVAQMLATIVHPIQPFYEEALLLKIYIAAQKKNAVQFNQLVNEWLDLDPDKAVAKTYEAGLDYQHTTWTHLHKWCLEVYNHPQATNYKGAFYAGCVMRLKSPKEAFPFAQHSFNNISPITPQLRGFFGWLTLANGNVMGAKQVLRGGDLATSNYGQRAMADICQNHADSECIVKKIRLEGETRPGHKPASVGQPRKAGQSTRK